jgi:hypothetical protein
LFDFNNAIADVSIELKQKLLFMTTFVIAIADLAIGLKQGRHFYLKYEAA